MFTLTSPDLFGRDVVKCYGIVHLPSLPGTHERTVQLFSPLPVSKFTGFLGFMKGNIAEYRKPAETIAYARGREGKSIKSKTVSD